MRKYTKFGSFELIHEIAIKFIELAGYQILETPEGDFKATKFMMKTLILMGNINTDQLVEILPKVKVLVYVGNDVDVAMAIQRYIDEKDIPKQVDNSGISGSVEAWSDAKQTIEIYSSFVYSDLELVVKYISGSGPKLGNMIRYISQVQTGRNSEVFDHPNLIQLESVFKHFMEYHENCEKHSLKYDKDDLLEIYNKYKP